MKCQRTTPRMTTMSKRTLMTWPIKWKIKSPNLRAIEEGTLRWWQTTQEWAIVSRLRKSSFSSLPQQVICRSLLVVKTQQH